MKKYARDWIIEEMATSGRWRVELDGSLWHRRGHGIWRRCEARHPQGYLYAGGNKRQVLVHRVVYRLWYGRLDSTCDVHHKNGVRDDNRPGNLEMLTPAEHMAESYRLGHQPSRKGEGHGCAKLTNADVIAIRESSAPAKELARRYNILPGHVRAVQRGHAWKHIPLEESNGNRSDP